jgi:hypothetical protein
MHEGQNFYIKLFVCFYHLIPLIYFVPLRNGFQLNLCFICGQYCSKWICVIIKDLFAFLFGFFFLWLISIFFVIATSCLSVKTAAVPLAAILSAVNQLGAERIVFHADIQI